MEERLSAVLYPYEGRKDALIPMLQKVQEELGYLPEEAMMVIARITGMPESHVYGVATFYAQFYFSRRGKNQSKRCSAKTCHLKGAARVKDAFERQLGISCGSTSEDYEHSLETVACVGSCALAPVVVVNEDVHGNMTIPKIEDVLTKLKGDQ